jgi:hypothetical protein
MQFRLVVAAVLIAPQLARAGSVEPDPRADDAFDFMNILARRHAHDLNDERWNIYGQLTWIDQAKLAFHAPYTNFGQPMTCDKDQTCGNSLSPDFAHSFTVTLTLYAGVKLWHGAELYFSPELLSELPFDDLTGLGMAVQNFELQKGGKPAPVVYPARLYLSQTFDLCSREDTKDVVVSNPRVLGKKLARRRVVLTLGRFSVIDFFDSNSYAGDLRRQLMNIAFMTYGAFDFTADARGYTHGGVAELFFDDWTARIGHTAPPKLPNRSDMDFSFGVFAGLPHSPGGQTYGDQVEIEHKHEIAGLAGAVRVLAYRNVEFIGRFVDATTLFAADQGNSAMNVGTAMSPAAQCTDLGGGGVEHGAFANHISRANAPDLCYARKLNTKVGIGINVEQAVAKDIGVFLRAMWADGQTEVQAYLPTDRSLSFGGLARGGRWGRRNDYAGVGFAAGWISKEHADYYRLGGIDGFVGDGKLNQAAELMAEAFYGANVTSSIWISGDYQLIANPGFNADRGPLHVIGGRFHAEF